MRFILYIVIVVLGVLFVFKWNKSTPMAYGTGDINAANVASSSHTEKTASGTPIPNAPDTIQQIVDDPSKFVGKTVTVNGRVHGTSKYASNRNMYTLVGSNGAQLLVIDDKTPPELDHPRTATGPVKTIGPAIGGLQKPYVIDVKAGAKIDTPKWSDVAHFFTDKVSDIKQGAKEIKNGG